MTDLHILLIAFGLICLLILTVTTLLDLDSDARAADAFYARLNRDKAARRAARRF